MHCISKVLSLNKCHLKSSFHNVEFTSYLFHERNIKKAVPVNASNIKQVVDLKGLQGILR